MLEAVLNSLVRWRAVVFVLGVVLAVAGAAMASRLSVNDSPERWLPASSNEAWTRFSQHFGYGDTVAVAIEFHRDVRDDDIEFLRELRLDLAEIPEVGRVIDASLVAADIEQVPLTTLLEQPAADAESDPFEMYRGVLFDDPAAWRNAGNEDVPGRTLVCFVELQEESLAPTPQDAEANGETRSDASGADTEPNASNDVNDASDAASADDMLNEHRRSAVTAIYDVLEEHERDDATFHMIGGIVIQHELEKIARHNAATFLPLCLVLTLVGIGWVFRSMSSVWIVVIGGIWAVSVMLGGVALAGWTLNVVTVGGPTLMMVIIIASTVHFSHYYSIHHRPSAMDTIEEKATTAADRKNGKLAHRKQVVRWVAVPCLGAAMTTGVGFLMLGFNELGPIRELGIELFVGAVLAFFGTFLAWMALSPLNTTPGTWLASERLVRLERWVVGRPLVTVAVLAVLLTGLAWTSRWLSIDADPFSFFQPESKVAKAFDHFSDRKFGLYNLDVVLVPRKHPDDPQQLAEVRREDRRVANEFIEEVSARPEVRNTISAISLGTRQRILQLNLADLRRFLAFQDTFRNWTVDRQGKDAIRVTFAVYDPGTGFVPLVDAMRDALPTERFHCFYTGAAANVATLSEGLVGGISRGLVAALCVMMLLCLFLFRSVRLTLVAFLPNIFPVLLVFGVMGLFGVPLNSGSAMVTTVALGVALNDTVHFMMHYQRRRQEGCGTDAAVADTFAEIGRPIILTSVVNCLGFGIFLFSDFRPLYHFGLLASLAMVAALVGDLIMLPNLLKLFDRREVTVPETEPVTPVVGTSTSSAAIE